MSKCPLDKNLDLLKSNLLAWKQLNKIPLNDKLIKNIIFISDSCVPHEDIKQVLMDGAYSTDRLTSSTNQIFPGPNSSTNTEAEFVDLFDEILFHQWAQTKIQLFTHLFLKSNQKFNPLCSANKEIRLSIPSHPTVTSMIHQNSNVFGRN